MNTCRWGSVPAMAAVAVMLLSSCDPKIPHEIAGREDCLACHGVGGTKPYPAWHAKRAFTDEKCLKCHETNA